MTESECYHRPAFAGDGFFLAIFITGQQSDRWEGALLFGYYISMLCISSWMPPSTMRHWHSAA
jgi:hypothetical protein